jgi:hypothetical protein
VEDNLKQDFGLLNEDRLDGELAPIEAALYGKEITFFFLKESILLYDLTSTN